MGDYRQAFVGTCSEPAQNIEAPEAGHLEVEQEQVWEGKSGPITVLAASRDIRDCLCAIVDGVHRTGRGSLFHRASDQKLIVLRVVRYKNIPVHVDRGNLLA